MSAPAMKKSFLTVEHLWQCERIGTPSLSPDGRWVVVDQTTYSMESNESATQLWLYSTDGKTRKQLTSAGKKNTAPQWSPDGKLIAFCAKREGDDAPQLYLIAPDGGEARRVTSLSTGVSSAKWFADSKSVVLISDVWPELKDDKAQAKKLKEEKESKVQAKVIEVDNYRYWDHWICNGQRPHLFEVNIASGKCRDLFAGKPWTLSLTDAGANDFAISPDGNEIAWVQPTNPTRTLDPTIIMLMNLKSRKTKSIDLGNMSLGAPTFSNGGERIALLATPNSGAAQHTRLMVWSRTTGKTERLAATWPRSVGTYGMAQLQWTNDDQSIVFNAEDSGQQHLYSLPLDRAEPLLIAMGGTIAAFDIAANGQSMVYTRSTIDHPAQLMACSLPPGGRVREREFSLQSQSNKHEIPAPPTPLPQGEGSKTTRLDRTNAFLEKVKLGDWESRTFRGWKGEAVQTFICYPPNYDPKKKYPLLQNVHGGPHAAHLDTFHYRWNMHAFAAQGYVVAAVNFHGSAGFDEKFLGTLHANMSEPAFADVEAVTDALIKEGIVDKNRLYAAGGSYGGHMVAWMNGHTDRYKAFVCHAGVYDWQAQFGDDMYLWTKEELGVWPWEDPKKHGAQSPHTYAKNMKTPTLVIHGELDYRVPYYEGLEYYNTLRAKGIAARLVIYPDENHWILKPQNSRLWYTEFFAWLKRF
ncbi:MAG: S9 family peptidase [Burkholderiales bacterium]|nr:MAG: S9 family peptidase [Betaproteobacteria bacterium]TAG25443.1 MAG: S9 family peptidase [Burkholderiales bacterium]